MGWIEMLHEDECYAVIGWQSSEQLGAGLQPPGRCAYADDRKVLWLLMRPSR